MKWIGRDHSPYTEREPRACSGANLSNKGEMLMLLEAIRDYHAVPDHMVR